VTGRLFIRKRLSHALTGSLRDDPDHETGRDIVHALGLTDDLGGVLWRLKYDNDSTAFERAVALLREAANVSPEIAALAVTEWAEGACRRCKGQSEVTILDAGAEKRMTCSSCNGTGLHRFGDRERAHRLRVGMSQVRRWSARIKRAADAIGTADKKKAAQMHGRLLDD